ncbi:hypothetical protein BROUX41_005903 [Berkeleyomyces rouxiae]|uniref:uncharacterized protein n=1 Tax=Berkeleyomyces rouxiae TaxID=2035830 RepID=UPI003B823355
MTTDRDARREAVLQAMADSLPPHAKDDETSDMSASYEVIALALHAYLSMKGLRLHGESGTYYSGAHTPQLPASWNGSFGSCSFTYTRAGDPVPISFAVERAPTDRNKVQIRGSVASRDQPCAVDVGAPRDLVCSAALPLRIKIAQDTHEEDRSDLPAQLQALFVSDVAIDELLDKIERQIVQDLISNAHNTPNADNDIKSSAETTTEPTPDSILPRLVDDPPASFTQPARPNPYPAPDVLDAPRNVPQPVPAGELALPGFDDEHEIQGPLRPLRPLHAPPGLGIGGRGGIGMGHDDLNPPGLGPQDPLRQSFVPGGGHGRQTGGHRGMHPTMDELMFPDQNGEFSGSGDLFNPQVPPGARWDPTGPGGRPGRNNGRFGGGGGGGFGGFGGGPII